MENFTLSVSDISYQTKPTKVDYPKMTFNQKEVNIMELSYLIAKGYAFTHIFNTPNFKIKYKVNKNFKEANLLALDYDNSPLSFDYVIQKLLIKPSIAYTTYSNAPGKNRFRLIYVISNSIESVEEYRSTTLKLNEIIFTQEDYNQLKDAFDLSCSSAVQLFLGTNITTQSIGYSDTIISLPLEKNTSKNQSNSSSFNYLTSEILHTYKMSCPKTDVMNNNIITKDLNHSFTFGTPTNNVIYSQNPLNNFNRAVIDNPSSSYHYVGDQYIYQLNTYMNGSKVKVGKRQKTLMYHAILLKKMNPEIEPKLLFNKLRWVVDTYYELPYEIDNNQLIRLSKSVISKVYDMEKDKRQFIRDPGIDHLSKGDKIKEFHKCKSEITKSKILGSVDLSKTTTQISEELGYSPATIRKYLKMEGIDLKEMRFNQFKEIYQSPDNRGKKDSEFIALTGIGKSQVYRYISKIKKE